MTVSIIITCKHSSDNLNECIKYCKELKDASFEVIVLPDEMISLSVPGVKIFPTGNVLPAKKRDMALAYALGEVLAFIDDDAYPRADWLKNAVTHFDNPEIAAVCGPAVTPDSDSIMQKASGLVYESILVSGEFASRYKPGSAQLVDDYPSCNFIVRRNAFERIGGFDTEFWPGEDTILCLKLTHELKKQIIYDPQVLVYHHRRRLFGAHLKQIVSYALHRGYFVKKFPQNSLKAAYFIPSIFVLGLLVGALVSLFSELLRDIYFVTASFYLFSVLLFSFNRSVRLMILVFIGTILTHIEYGIYFLKGLFSKRLKEEL